MEDMGSFSQITDRRECKWRLASAAEPYNPSLACAEASHHTGCSQTMSGTEVGAPTISDFCMRTLIPNIASTPQN